MNDVNDRKEAESSEEIGDVRQKLYTAVYHVLNDAETQNVLYSRKLLRNFVAGPTPDQLEGAQGEFGRDPRNPILCNGPLGEGTYLSRLLLASSGEKVFYHRLGSIAGNIDVFELLSQSGAFYDILYLDMYHWGRSGQLPKGYRHQPDVTLPRGVTNYCHDFPRELEPAIAKEYEAYTFLPLADPDALNIDSRRAEQTMSCFGSRRRQVLQDLQGRVCCGAEKVEQFKPGENLGDQLHLWDQELRQTHEEFKEASQKLERDQRKKRLGRAGKTGAPSLPEKFTNLDQDDLAAAAERDNFAAQQDAEDRQRSAKQDLYLQGWAVAGKRLSKMFRKYQDHGRREQDFRWLRTDPVTSPFDSMIFLYGKNIYSVLVDFWDEKGNSLTSKDYRRRQLEVCRANKLLPCLFPLQADTLLPFDLAWNLRDAKTRMPLDPLSQPQPLRCQMSQWELLHFSISLLLRQLQKRGLRILSFCDTPGVVPQIWFTNEQHQKCWVAVTAEASYALQPLPDAGILRKILPDHPGYQARVTFSPADHLKKLYRGRAFFVTFTGLYPLKKDKGGTSYE